MIKNFVDEQILKMAREDYPKLQFRIQQLPEVSTFFVRETDKPRSDSFHILYESKNTNWYYHSVIKQKIEKFIRAGKQV